MRLQEISSTYGRSGSVDLEADFKDYILYEENAQNFKQNSDSLRSNKRDTIVQSSKPGKKYFLAIIKGAKFTKIYFKKETQVANFKRKLSKFCFD